MLSLEKKIGLLDKLGSYMLSADDNWQKAKEIAMSKNAWFTADSIKLATWNIAHEYLQKDKLQQWLSKYTLPAEAKKIGIVMAGNIPLVGFHDFLCGFISGHKLLLKLSSKDEILISHVIKKLAEWAPEVLEQVKIAERINGCDAYIATGSNNTSRYFEEYFGKYPHIIRKNRTSAAILTGNETNEELEKLADDIFTYYGLGCRNVSQLYLPRNYNLSRLFKAFANHKEVINHNKYKNNYDYYLAIYLLNKVPCLTDGIVLLVENTEPFSAVSVLNYQYYEDMNLTVDKLQKNIDIQCIIGHNFIPFGTSQTPSLSDYADGVDTMEFLCNFL
jgi:hypothetical protein